MSQEYAAFGALERLPILHERLGVLQLAAYGVLERLPILQITTFADLENAVNPNSLKLDHKTHKPKNLKAVNQHQKKHTLDSLNHKSPKP